MCSLHCAVDNFIFDWFFCTDVSILKRKKSKNKRSRSKDRDSIADMASNVHMQNSLDNNTAHHSPEHHSVSKTDTKHMENPAKLVSEQKRAKKKRNRTDAESACGTVKSEGDAASEAEEQQQKSKHKSVGSLDADPSAHHQIETRSESGISKSAFSVILSF